MGGTFALLALAAGRLPAASLVAMATPVALHDDGLLSTWCRAPHFDPAQLARAYGNVPPHLLQPAFKMLDPLGLAQKFVHLDKNIEDDHFVRFFLAIETWLEDSVAFPGRAFVDWVKLYRDDSLATGTLTLGGARIDLREVRCPIFNIVADNDYITPPPSSLALEKLVGARDQRAVRTVRTVRIKGGHIGLATGRAAHEHLWPEVSAWLHAHDAPAQRPARAHDANAQRAMPVAARKVARKRKK